MANIQYTTYKDYIDLQDLSGSGFAEPTTKGAIYYGTSSFVMNDTLDVDGNVECDAITADGAGTFGSLVVGGASLSATELESIDGDTSATATTLVAGDRFVCNDAGTMKQVALSDLETFMESSLDTMGSQFTSATGLAAVGTITTGTWQGTAVARAYIAADAIDGTKLADDAVDSEHLAAGSIDNEHMAANSVDSDQYVDGSIDLVHMSANSVDSDQYVDGSVDNVHLANSTTTIGSTSCALGSTTTAFAGLTGLNFTAANASIAASIGANTLTLGGSTSTVDVAGALEVTDGIDCAEGLVLTTNSSGYALTIQEDGFDVTGDSVMNGDLTLGSDDDLKARSFITYSDAKLKTNVETVTNAMDMIQGLRGVSYDLKSGGKREFGFIAQEVNNVVPEVVSTSGNVMGIDYTRITSLLVEAVKTQQAQIEALKAKLDK